MSTQSIDPPSRHGRPPRSNRKSNDKDRKKKSRSRSRSADYLDNVYKVESSSSSPPTPIHISTIDPESLWRQLSFETINDWPTQSNNAEEAATTTPRQKEENTTTTTPKIQRQQQQQELQLRPNSKIKDILIFDTATSSSGHDEAFRSLRSLMDGREFFNLANSEDSPFLLPNEDDPQERKHEHEEENEEEQEEITVMRMEVPNDYQHKRISFQDIMNSRDYGLLAPPTVVKKESYQQKQQQHRHRRQQQLQSMVGGDGSCTKKKNSSIIIILEEAAAEQEQQKECLNGNDDSKDCNNDDEDTRDDDNRVSMAIAGRIPSLSCAIKKNGTTPQTPRTKSPLYRRMIGTRRRATNRRESPCKK